MMGTREDLLKTQKRAGFTLVEVLVSLVVLAISLIALWGFHLKSGDVNLENRRQTTAVFLAMEKMEAMRADAVLEIFPLIGTVEESIEKDGVLFTVNTVVDQNILTWRRNITVTVSWERRGNAPSGSVVLQSLIVTNN